MAKRLIEMKRYRGAFIAPRNQWNYLDTDVLQWVLENDYDPRLISAMSEIRNPVEPAIARWAAERATSSDLAEIESALNDMIANNRDREAFNEADIRYHEAVLQSVHNPVLQQLNGRSARYSERYLNGLDGRCGQHAENAQNIRRYSMRYGIRMAMRQSRRH